MASLYPDALDALVNPTATSNMATVSHSEQHIAANDAIEAIEATLGTNPEGSETTVADRLAAVDVSVANTTTGPTSSVSNNIATFDGITGKALQDSGSSLSSGSLTLSGTLTAAGLAGDLLSSEDPLINDVAAPGVSAVPAREDHVHPSDTTKTNRVLSTTADAVVRFDNTSGALAESTVIIGDTGNVTGIGTLGTSGKITAGADVEVTTSVRIGGPTGPLVLTGNGDPESVVTAPVSSLFLRGDGGAATSLYVKETGTGNTGWVAK